MEGLASLLDPVHDARIRAVWSELEDRLGLRGIFDTPYPHFSYQIAPAYDAARLEIAARDLALNAEPFDIETSGLALFTGPEPVLYLAIVRTAALSAWHTRVWQAALPAARDPVPYYLPDHWMPHITLAQGDLDPDSATQAMRLLADRDFHWTIHIDNLSYGGQADDEPVLRWRLPLGGHLKD